MAIGVSKPLDVQNYGTFSFATKPAAGASCLLLAARWHSGWEPSRGHGMYIAGSWYAVENGAFARVEDRPAIYRRYVSALKTRAMTLKSAAGRCRGFAPHRQ
jgi:hypothetical protein